MPKIITIGEILVEIMTDNKGQSFLKPGSLSGPFPSGAPAIFIDQVAKMNIDCGIISAVGDDDFGLMNFRRLKKDGVDTSQIVTKNYFTTGTAFVTYLKSDERKFIYHFSHSAAGQLAPEDIDNKYLAETDYLHIMGCSLAASSKMRQAIKQAIDLAKKENLCISFDPNLRPELLEINAVRNIFKELLFKSDIILTGRNEISLLIDDDENDILKLLFSKGVKIVVLRDGANAVKTYTKSKEYSCFPPKVEEVDPTGAGDCFDGAFIAALAKGYDIQTAARFGSAAGALSVLKKGPMEGTSSQEEIEYFLSK